MGECSISTTTKLNVSKCTRLRHPDRGVVGNRGPAAELGQAVSQAGITGLPVREASLYSE